MNSIKHTKPRPSLAALMAGMALILTAGAITAPSASATPLTDTARERLQTYAGQAKKTAPSFTAFSAERGRTLYFSEHKTKDGKTISCSTCHTRDPAKEGRSDVGKTLAPLSPAVNPKRFTDADEVEKWFRRNCKEVLGRVCTPQEKGDFILFLFS